ncbi:MAG TPA: sigma-E factor negative regulatory protein [Steroidobacteraceae bacterium]|nr:sigma-E factor negative regulatory protein [Steroidobacteraceae bacterium]
MNEELDSQLSAMFDDELPPAECELLARRLSRDENLKARWGRYAIVGAVIRAERGVRLNAPLAGRVNAVLLAEPALAAHTAPRDLRRPRLHWWQPLAGAAVAAGVATLSIMWLRTQSLNADAPLVARTTPAASMSAVPAAAGPAASYVVPLPKPASVVVPSTELANYVVAHSMFSPPVARRNLLSAFMVSEPAAAGAEEPQSDAKAFAQ